eukprot:CAMPEP_0174704130 /NCGR_PEP_ID=MMETSP1094-20130205/7842_1 /TAXON_ID=156173 /ORGANISM="Chrysochromulina brevifilum, Strain UTEX LB 985" /LENGTH=33 /DNA_ID= /DNA_START= /DNA_END= /DNA_ORIENTATION=
MTPDVGPDRGPVSNLQSASCFLPPASCLLPPAS